MLCRLRLRFCSILKKADFYEKVHAKAMEYLAAGVKQVWVISPENRTITIYRSATNILAFPEDSELVSEDLFPGFRHHLSEVFKNPAQTAR